MMETNYGQKTKNESKFLFCPNEQCSSRLLNRFKHFVGKKGLDIKGISEATLSKLIDWGWLNTYQDIFLTALGDYLSASGLFLYVGLYFLRLPFQL